LQNKRFTSGELPEGNYTMAFDKINAKEMEQV